MRQLVWAGLVVAAAVAVMVSCAPDFKVQEQESSGTGAAGGGAGGAGGEMSSTGGGGMDGGTGGTGGEPGPPMPQVACGEPGSVECSPGDVCCYHTTTAACDKCGPGRCLGDGNCAQGDYVFFHCDDAQDCSNGAMCCMTYVEMLGTEYYQGSVCQPSCSDVQHRLCSRAADCDVGQTCMAIQYPGYMRCL